MPLVEEPRRNLKQRGTLWKLVFRQLPLEHETTAFILVNVLDFFMTYLMLNLGFRESNWIARYFLDGWGPIRGMLFFKLLMVTFVCVVAQVVATRQIQTARWLLNAGTIAVSFTVIYSLSLLLKHG